MPVSFDGTNDGFNYGDIAALDAQAAMSVAYWVVTRTGVAANDGHVSKRASSLGFTIGCGAASTEARCITDNAANSGALAGGFTLDTWTHLVWVYDGAGAANIDRLKLYKDGVLQTLTFSGTIPATNYGDPGAQVLNVANESGGNFAACEIGHLKIWNAALTANDAFIEYKAYRPLTNLTKLLVWAPYNDGVAGIDFAGSNATTTLDAPTGGKAEPTGFIYPDMVRNQRRAVRRGMDGYERRNAFRRTGPLAPYVPGN